MRALPPALAARLASGVTTLCRCWRLTRRDGGVAGFTDHDEDIAFGGMLFAAGTGLDAAEATAEAGLAVGGGEVAGALSAAGITDADLSAGLYDGAGVETWLVDWTEPEVRALLDVATLGEVRRAGGAFTAELRSPAHALDQTRGRLYGAACDADLGDAACGVDLDAAGRRAVGTVLAGGPGGFTCAAAAGFPAGSLAHGLARFTGGALAGASAEIAGHEGAEVRLWRPLPRAPEPGDAVVLQAGCDKSWATCRARFANAPRFRGFPHLPGLERLAPAPRGVEPMDGSSLFR